MFPDQTRHQQQKPTEARTTMTTKPRFFVVRVGRKGWSDSHGWWRGESSERVILGFHRRLERVVNEVEERLGRVVENVQRRVEWVVRAGSTKGGMGRWSGSSETFKKG
jgi:hypothetical protein